MTRILVVDDNAALRAAVSERLSFYTGLEVVGEAGNGSEAVHLASRLRPDVVIMDVQMPEMDGVEATRIIHQNQPSCQIVAHTAFEDRALVSEMIRAGAKAYLLKGGQSDDLIRAIDSVTQGQSFVTPVVARPLLDDLETLYRLEQDRTRQLQAMVERLNALNVTDYLTGLSNHRHFHLRLAEEVARADSQRSTLAMVTCNLDDFHLVNARFGHAVGDAVLREVAARIVLQCPGADVTARTGGEEFSVLMAGATIDVAVEAAERVVQAVRDHTFGAGGEITASAGVALYPIHAGEKDSLLDRAERALRVAKARGKDGVVSYSAELSEPAGDDVSREGQLRAIFALARAVDARDPYTGLHSQRLARYARSFALGMGITDERLSVIRAAALLHDVGKIGVRDAVLLKPGVLTDLEFSEMKEHPVLGEQIVTGAVDHQVARAIRHHHERIDGNGYPDGLKGDDIPLASRILLVADAFDAMTSDRIYRMALPLEKAVGELRKYAGIQFDADVVEAAITLIDDGTVSILD